MPAHWPERGGPPLAKPIALFLEALEKEETLDFKKVEQQRAGLLESLAQKMNPTQTNELVSRSVSYRAGHLTYGDFYRWIGALCEDVGVPLSQFPAMAGYIRYVLLSETIDAEDLLAECDGVRRFCFEQLAKTDDERDLINQSRYMTLVEKLLDFSLTPDEWAITNRSAFAGGRCEPGGLTSRFIGKPTLGTAPWPKTFWARLKKRPSTGLRPPLSPSL
jgi:hypothetical protein